MKIVSIRLTRGRLAAMVIGAAVLLIGLLLLLPDKEAPAAGTEQQRQQYLVALGLDPEPGSEQVQAVRLPAEFTGIYREYQAIQTACGYDLAPYRGREVLLCRWRLRGGEEPMGAELLVWDGQVIGGSKYTLRIDGGLWGLTEN